MEKKKELIKRPLKVLFLPVDDGGCGWYRVRQLHEAFRSLETVESVMPDPRVDDEEYLIRAIDECDVVVARTAGFKYVKLIKEQIDPYKPIIFDHDDNTMDLLPTNEHYFDFGTQDAWTVDKGVETPVWVTGQNGFNKYKNYGGQLSLMYLLWAADMITAPVPQLLKYYSQFTQQQCLMGVVPNMIDSTNFPDGKIVNSSKKGGEIRIGWQGGVSHLGDWKTVNTALHNVLKDYPEVSFHIMGSYYGGLFNDIKDRLTFYGWVPFKGYTFKMASMDLDIALIPLQEAAFNTYKSEVKFSEFAKLQVPVLVKDMLPYSAVCEDGNNCFAYKDEEEFEKKLRMMIEDIKKGGKRCSYVAKNAKKWVDKERDLDKKVQGVVDLYKTVLSQDVLDELL